MNFRVWAFVLILLRNEITVKCGVPSHGTKNRSITTPDLPFTQQRSISLHDSWAANFEIPIGDWAAASIKEIFLLQSERLEDIFQAKEGAIMLLKIIEDPTKPALLAAVMDGLLKIDLEAICPTRNSFQYGIHKLMICH
ncbi:hypothetical protein FRC17_008151, partial [Serendipita sp. 399]